jgi:hypothetical protein
VRGVIANATLSEIVEFLNDSQVRATYTAVGEVLGVVPRSVGALLGPRRPEASWVVNASTGMPTGYGQQEMHPALFHGGEIIATGREMALRLAVWRVSRGG